MKKKIWTVLVAGVFAAVPAAAQQFEPQPMQPQPQVERTPVQQPLAVDDLRLGEGGALVTDLGAALFAGGGVHGFTNENIAGDTDAGGYWNVRGVIGTRSIIGGEVAYVGSAQGIDTIGAPDSTLVSNGLEGALRLQAPITQNELGDVAGAGTPVLIAPYVFGGLGWQRFDVLGTAETAAVQDVDNVMSVPLGVGIGAGIAGVTLDARFTYRPTFFNDLFGTALTSVGDTALNQWQLGANLGFEF
jgi:hypothetical protein